MSKKNIKFVVSFKGGAGSIDFTGVDGLPAGKTINCDPNNPVSPQDFDANQSDGPQSVIVGGTAPTGGEITVDIKDGDTVLTSATFKNGLFVGKQINYNVPEN